MLDFASENVSRGGVPNVGAQITQGRRWMNKSDLIAAMAEKAGVSNKDAGACLDAMFDVVADAVAAGNEKVTVPGWISFEQTVRKARQGRNPQTGEAISIPATKAVKVSAGSKLKAAAMSGGPPMGM